jgi:hypothetical protein
MSWLLTGVGAQRGDKVNYEPECQTDHKAKKNDRLKKMRTTRLTTGSGRAAGPSVRQAQAAWYGRKPDKDSTSSTDCSQQIDGATTGFTFTVQLQAVWYPPVLWTLARARCFGQASSNRQVSRARRRLQ